MWRTAHSGTFPLPCEYPLDFDDDRTWRLIYGDENAGDEDEDAEPVEDAADDAAPEEPTADVPEQEDAHQHPDPPVPQPPPVPQDYYALLQDMHRLQQHMYDSQVSVQTQQTQLWEHQQAMQLQQTQMFEHQ